MRNTWAAYLVNIETGKIEWTLGGRHSSFKFGPKADFQWQHDVALGTELDGDHVRRPLLPADRRRHLRASDRTLAWARAEARPADADRDAPAPVHGRRRIRIGIHGRHAAAWRTATRSSAGDRSPTSREYGPSGKRLLEARFPGNDLSYRTMREQWVGEPLTTPRARPRQAGGKTTVYASWNGATEVASWRVLATPRPGRARAPARVMDRDRDRTPPRAQRRMTAVASAARSGFETAIPVPSGERELRGAGARRGRPGDRSIAPVRAVGSMADEDSGRRWRRIGEINAEYWSGYETNDGCDLGRADDGSRALRLRRHLLGELRRARRRRRT